MKMSQYLRQQPKTYILGLSVLLVILVAAIQYLVPQASLTPLCLIPIALAAVPLGRWGGYITSAVAIGAWFYLVFKQAGDEGRMLHTYIEAGSWAVAFVFISEVLSRVKTAYVTAWEQSKTDGLTGVATAQHFWEFSQGALGEGRRENKPLSYAIMQVATPDNAIPSESILVGTASILGKLARKEDEVGRIGDQRFAVSMPATKAETSKAIARRLEDHTIKEMTRHEWKIEFSIAAVCFENLPADVEEMKEILNRKADEALAAGRNNMKHTVV